MNTILQIILWISLFGAIYSYFLYPLLLLAMPRRKVSQAVFDSTASQPFISIIVTAYNEASQIEKKILNTLEIDYPIDKREILIASDGSTDATNSIVQQYADKGVRLIEVQERKGKENAQLAAILQAKGNLLVFSDTATIIPPEALQHIVKAFEDPMIGAVSSEDRFISEDGKIAGEGAYVKYEMWLRRKEAEVKSLVGLSGSFFACRKQICNNWDISVPSDFNTALNCVTQGYVAISSPDVLGYYPNLKDESKEYQRKLRTVIRGMAAIASKPAVLNPFKMGFFAIEVISHKVMRWLVPWFMLSLLISSLILWQQHILYTLLLAAQLGFYGLASAGWLSKAARNHSLIKLPFFFIQVNLAIAHATLQFLSGKRITRWEPSKR